MYELTWYFPHLMTGANAMAAFAILAGVLVTIHDLRNVPARLNKTGQRAAYRVGLSAFLTLVCIGEALVLFEAVLGHGPAPRVPETLARIAWAGVSVWGIIARPFTTVEVLRLKREGCPVLSAAGVRPLTVGGCERRRHPLPVQGESCGTC